MSETERDDTLVDAIEGVDGHFAAYLRLCKALGLDPNEDDSTAAMHKAADLIEAKDTEIERLRAQAVLTDPERAAFGRLVDVVDEIMNYTGGADHALADEYVWERLKNARAEFAITRADAGTKFLKARAQAPAPSQGGVERLEIKCRCTAIDTTDENGRTALWFHDFTLPKIVNSDYWISTAPAAQAPAPSSPPATDELVEADLRELVLTALAGDFVEPTPEGDALLDRLIPALTAHIEARVEEGRADLQAALRSISNQCEIADDPEHHTLGLIKHIAEDALNPAIRSLPPSSTPLLPTDIFGIGASPDDDHVLRVRFRRPVVDGDRRLLLDAINHVSAPLKKEGA